MFKSLFRAVFFLVGLTAWIQYILEDGATLAFSATWWIALISFGIFFAIQDEMYNE